MFCRKCGTKLIEDSLFCSKCGTQVEEPDSKEVTDSKAVDAADSADSEVTVDTKEETLYPPGEEEKSAEPPAKAESSPLMFSPEDIQTPRSTSTSAPPQSSEKLSKTAPEKKAKPAPEEKPAEVKPPKADAEPKGAALPSELLPKPDGFERSNELERVEKEKAQLAKELKKEKRRWHPLDAYEPLRRRVRVGGCGLLFLLIVVIPVLTLGILGWIPYNRFVNREDFESVLQEEANVVDAPEENTLYWTWKIWTGALYEAEETEAEVAIIGGTWWLGGTFKEKVYFNGYQLILEDGAKFENGIEVNAFRFDAGNAEIEGELTGNIAFQD